jgi:hypothetical protein
MARGRRQARGAGGADAGVGRRLSAPRGWASRKRRWRKPASLAVAPQQGRGTAPWHRPPGQVCRATASSLRHLQ